MNIIAKFKSAQSKFQQRYCFAIVGTNFYVICASIGSQICHNPLIYKSFFSKSKVIMDSVCHDPAFTLHVYPCKRAFGGCRIHKNVQSMRIKDATCDPKFISYVISLSLNKSDRCLNPRSVGCPELTKCYIHFYSQGYRKRQGFQVNKEKDASDQFLSFVVFLIKEHRTHVLNGG